ncbi:hypothetical protein K490DRAFT_38191 [Saccharata proteae CBS 121410]|uniref:Uncharacterized protein n=1 Tax=Saccharata proteae CBS 121410 TaxID=1314787 RepID=A0A6A5YBB4_9PEZI|nr:hypothetical protein K490DRAFT_38191 [Saccharata proteae CBS 121410]
MGADFFNGWKLWEKMTFVLACSIVFVIFLGYCKVLYTNRKMKKLDMAGARAVQQPQMIEAAHPTHAGDDEQEVPFGIRAIQSGIEVDGIWISGNNTPAPSSPASSASSMPDRRPSAPRVVSNGDVTRLEMPPAAHGSSSRTSSRGRPVSSFDRAVSAERLSDSRASSAGKEAAARPRDPKTDLRLLQSHRLSHVAETGSLARRDKVLDRPPGRSGEWSSVALDMPRSTLAYPSPPSPELPPSPLSGYELNPFRTPPETARVTTPSRDSHPANTQKQAQPLLETYKPSRPRDFEDDVELGLQPPASASSGGRRLSQVLRKVNSGFEILRPGTFQQPSAPASADGSRDVDGGENRRFSKRLQKKRRPSTDSRRSSMDVV